MNYIVFSWLDVCIHQSEALKNHVLFQMNQFYLEKWQWGPRGKERMRGKARKLVAKECNRNPRKLRSVTLVEVYGACVTPVIVPPKVLAQMIFKFYVGFGCCLGSTWIIFPVKPQAYFYSVIRWNFCWINNYIIFNSCFIFGNKWIVL